MRMSYMMGSILITILMPPAFPFVIGFWVILLLTHGKFDKPVKKDEDKNS